VSSVVRVRPKSETMTEVIPVLVHCQLAL
jgi:hypothetical protein